MSIASQPRSADDNVAVARGNGIDRALARAVRKRPERTALSFENRSWTYARLERAAESVAARLAELGVVRGDRVAAYGRNSDAYVLLWLACTRAGFVHVPINYALTPVELAYVVTQSRSSALVYDADLASVVTAASDALGEMTRGRFAGGGEHTLTS